MENICIHHNHHIGTDLNQIILFYCRFCNLNTKLSFVISACVYFIRCIMIFRIFFLQFLWFYICSDLTLHICTWLSTKFPSFDFSFRNRNNPIFNQNLKSTNIFWLQNYLIDLSFILPVSQFLYEQLFAMYSCCFDSWTVTLKKEVYFVTWINIQN